MRGSSYPPLTSASTATVTLVLDEAGGTTNAGTNASELATGLTQAVLSAASQTYQVAVTIQQRSVAVLIMWVKKRLPLS